MTVDWSRRHTESGQINRGRTDVVTSFRFTPVEQTNGTHVVPLEAYGVPFTVVLGSEGFLAVLPTVLPHGATPRQTASVSAVQFSLLLPDGDRGFRCLIGQDVSQESATLEPVLEQLARDLMIHIANSAPDRVFVHAGVVSWNERAMVLPGGSFAGKTTLTAALLRLGATYYSDEYAVVDAEGAVHPYSRALQVRRPGETTQQEVSAAHFDAPIGDHALPVAIVVFVEYEQAAIWTPVRISPGTAVLEMLRHTIPVQRTPARVMATLTKMLDGASVWAGVRGEAAETAAQLLSWLDDPSTIL